MPQKRIGGTLHLKVAGEVMLARGSFSYNVGGYEREEVVGLDRSHGFTERRVSGRITGEISDDGSVKVAKLKSATGVTVSLELANGKMIVGSDMTAAGDFVVNADEGSIPIDFFGDVEEI